jgi:hypothetical protein
MSTSGWHLVNQSVSKSRNVVGGVVAVVELLLKLLMGYGSVRCRCRLEDVVVSLLGKEIDKDWSMSRATIRGRPSEDLSSSLSCSTREGFVTEDKSLSENKTEDFQIDRTETVRITKRPVQILRLVVTMVAGIMPLLYE